MPYLDHVLQPPSYGWADGNGKLIKPSVIQILKEFFTRLNVVSDRKNWLPFFSWLKVFCLLPFANEILIRLDCTQLSRV